jgi:nodulation protein E
MKRIVITGLGVISSIGNDLAAFRDSLFAGRSGVGKIALFDASEHGVQIAGEVKGYVPEDHFDAGRLALLDRFVQMGLVAAREAVRHSGIDFSNPALARRTGVFHGTGIGGQATQDQSYLRLYGERKRLGPTTVPRLIPSAGASQLSIEFGIHGPSMTLASACAASGHALANAVLMMRAGMLDAALVGGSEAMGAPGSMKAWEALRVLAQDTCRPFSLDRSGTVLGEGGAMAIVETLEHAQARGATIHAEVLGVGMSSDAFHPIQPDENGIALAIRNALADAGLAPEQVDYINAHGTATPQNDPHESKAIRIALGKHADRVAVSSTKSMHGHTLGAASAMELTACVMALQAQCAPPTMNYGRPDPDCDLDYVPNAARRMPMQVALNHSCAFGGLNVVTALRRW